MNRLWKKIFASFTILVLTFLPLLTTEVHAVEPWSGNPWDSSDRVWSGDPWEGKQTQWEDIPWEGNPWSGNPWKGHTWSLDGWSGTEFEGNSWINKGWDGSTTSKGNPWSGSSWKGYTITGDPWSSFSWSGKGTQGNSTEGSFWANHSFSGNIGQFGLSTLNAYDPVNPSDTSYQPPDRFYDSEGFKGAKYVWDSFSGGIVDFDPNNPGGFSQDYLKDVLVNTVKLRFGDSINFDYVDMADTTYKGLTSYQELEALRKGLKASNTATTVAGSYQTAQTASKWSQYGKLIKDSTVEFLDNTDITKISGTFNGMGFVSKLNLVSSGINAGLSTISTVNSVGDAINTFQTTTDGSERTAAVADAASSLGETIMSYGGLAAAVPGGQALGAGLVIAGGVIFVGGKAVKLVAENWDKIKNSTIVRKGKEIIDKAVEIRDQVVDKAKDVGKKIFKSIKGWFS